MNIRLFEGLFLAALALVFIRSFLPRRPRWLIPLSLLSFFALVHLSGLKLAQQLAIVKV
jgi:hypothetical protein